MYLQLGVELGAPLGVLEQQRRVDVVQRVVERRHRRVHHGGDEDVAVQVLGGDHVGARLEEDEHLGEDSHRMSAGVPKIKT